MKYKSKLAVLITFLFGIGNIVSAQSKNGLESPFYLGLKGGVNFSHVMVLSQYQIFTSLTDEVAGTKDYNKIYQNLGYQYGFIGLYRLNEKMSIIFEPTFAHYKFGYENNTTWQDTDDESIARSSNQTHNQHLQYLELPLLFQVIKDMTPVKPYALVGGYYGRLLGAEKILHTDEITTIDDQDFTTSSEDQHLFFNDQYIKSRLTAVAEIGIIYPLNDLEIMFGIGYHYSFNNITSENARYSNQLITGTSYDINDNIRLNSVNINLRILFPINKPSNLIKSLKCKQ